MFVGVHGLSQALGTISTVPRAYEWMQGRKNKNEGMKNRKI
jgi:hypothetical protein